MLRAITLVASSIALFAVACAPVNTQEDASVFDAGPQCRANLNEPDFQPSPWQSGAGQTLQALPAGSYMVSATYLTLRPGSAAAQEFQQLMTAINMDLRTRDGLVAYSVNTSSACLTARTVSVWRDEAAMLAFVRAPAHLAGVSAISRISRGGSNTTHWSANASDITWPAAIERIGAAPGPTF